ncbi:MAG: VWA domain-containing protein [Erysipelotrichaceae bacterium]|uniref:DUF7604 domain-containing protein n=1 Tax=Floccifex sp. TaxID=2815810 RepID=UPI002A76041A|nr:VWA domain-containing protein [Floccifex sp.]MDD7280464.1 VWA domain-containing protein [Erysipelotrichaceae bacterium]MDY2958818.1 VWA domain-containing protein [Floccifex sp.]
MKKILKCFIPCFIAATMCLGLVQASSFIKAEEETVEQVQEETTPTEPETATEQEPVEEDPVPEESTNEQPITEETETSDPVEEETESSPKLDENQEETTEGVPLTLDAVTLADSTSTFEPAHSKKIKYDGDDKYTLKLDVTGQYDSEAKKQPVDVLLILDKSGSMEGYNMKTLKYVVTGRESKNSWWDSGEGLSDILFSNENLNVRMSAVAYSGYKTGDNTGSHKVYIDSPYNDAIIVSDWVSSQSGFESAILNISTGGGTNPQAGFREAREMLVSSFRPEAQKYVIFLTDGIAGYYYDEDGYTQGNGDGEDTTGNAKTKAKGEVQKITGLDGFYTIAFGKDSDKDLVTELTQVSDATNKDNFTAYDLDELQEKFDQIAAQITEFKMTDVTIQDTLSQYVDLVTDPKKINIVASDGSEVGNPIVTVSSDKKTITASFGTEQFPLQKDVTYSIQFQVKVNQDAYVEYAKSGYGEIKGDENTDLNIDNPTSSNQPGFYSNVDDINSTFVSYTYNGENGQVAYQKPVVQVHPKNITISKDVTGSFGDKTRDFDFQVQLKRPGTNGTPGAVYSENGTIKALKSKNGQKPSSLDLKCKNGIVVFTLKDDESITLQNIQPNSTYKVTEKLEDKEGYTTTVKVGENTTTEKETSGILTDDVTIAFTNNKDATPITGIGDDNHSSLGMIGVIVVELGAIYLVLKKKRQLKM